LIISEINRFTNIMNIEIKHAKGIKRFYPLVNDLKKIFEQIKNEEDIALNFYQSDARRILFYLKSLTKIYKKISDKPTFKTLENQFKTLENLLGKIDFYDSYWKEFSETPAFPTIALNLVKQKYIDALKSLNEYLDHESWLKKDNYKFDIILADLERITWPNEEEDTPKVAKVLSKQVKKIGKKYKNGSLDFNQLENGIHKFRRKIRWFSIQAQALNGLIQLVDDDFKEPLKFYRTPEVLKSKFNHLPKAQKEINTIDIPQSTFYALSWLISYTGDLKDEGLKVLFLEEILIEAKLTNENDAFNKAIALLEKDEFVLQTIIKEAKFATDQFIYTHRVLDILRKDLKTHY
jgi:hypothetical protein